MAAWPSTQNTLHAGTTSGWNDPPTMDNNRAPINSGLNRRQRLVDPSITGVGSQGGYTSAPASQFSASPAGYNTPSFAPQPGQQQRAYGAPSQHMQPMGQPAPQQYPTQPQHYQSSGPVPQYGQQPQQYVDHHQPQPQGGVGQMSAGTGAQHQPQPHQQSYQM